MVAKAVILAAGRGTRFLPYTKSNPKEMIAVIDKPALQLVVEEIISSGIEDILIVTSSAKQTVRQYFSSDKELEDFLFSKNKIAELDLVRRLGKMANISYVNQENAGGSGQAVLLAEKFACGEPVAILNGDDVMYTEKGDSVLRQLVKCYERNQTTVIGVQLVEKDDIKKYGAIEISCRKEKDIKICGIVEKPRPENAPSLYAALGRYIISGDFYDYIRKTPVASSGELQFTDALKLQAKEKGIYACEFEGKRYDLGDKLGYAEASVEFALRHEEIGKKFAAYIKELAKTM